MLRLRHGHAVARHDDDALRLLERRGEPWFAVAVEDSDVYVSELFFGAPEEEPGPERLVALLAALRTQGNQEEFEFAEGMGAF